MTATETASSCRPAGENVPGADHGAVTVLVAEDDADARRLVVSLLRRDGYEVLLAGDGEEALDLAERHHPDLILMDCDMPGVNGFQACSRLRADPRFDDVPVLFVTALDATGAAVNGFDAGASDYITKPVGYAELSARMTTHLALARSRRQLRRQAEQLERVVESQSGRLDQVRDGQANMLAESDAIAELRTAVRFRPALEAGGDFYDLIRFTADTCGLLVADVSGHDLGVAYVTGALKALTASFTNDALSVHDTLVMMNAALRRFLEPGQYVTACYAKFARSQMRVEYSVAGHPAPLVQTADGSTLYLDAVGDVLGMHETVTCDVATLDVRPGDRLFLYTDGLTESYRSPSGRSGDRIYGASRLAESVAATRAPSLATVVDEVVDQLVAECGGVLDDDVILLGAEF